MTHIKSLVLAVVVLSVAVSVTFARPGAEKEGKHPHGHAMMKCAGEDFTVPSEDSFEMAKTCINQTTTADLDCMAVCIGQKTGLIDATGAIVKANVAAKIAASAPASKVAAFTTAMNTCIDQNSGSLDVTKCASYKPLITCGHTALMTICQWTPEKL